MGERGQNKCYYDKCDNVIPKFKNNWLHFGQNLTRIKSTGFFLSLRVFNLNTKSGLAFPNVSSVKKRQSTKTLQEFEVKL